MALVIVLLVLLALLVLATPFLMMARKADRASAQLADRTEARVALDTAARHGRFLLSGSHPAVDPTPFSDGLDELAVDNRFAADFYDANDATGTMWDVDATDLAGLVDLDSAGPFVLANLVGGATRLVEAADRDAAALKVARAADLEPTGFVWIGGELVRYGAVEGGSLVDLTRGVLSRRSADGDELDGPRVPLDHGLGAPVLDQRALGPVVWRTMGPGGRLRTFDTPEELAGAADFMLATALEEGGLEGPAAERRAVAQGELLDVWRDHGTVHAAARGGRVWQRAARLIATVEGGRDGRLQLDTVQWVNPGATIRIDDGAAAELAVVYAVDRTGLVRLDRVLQHTYEAFSAEVRVLARRPVNVNTAPPRVLQALFENLQLTGRNARITRGEAKELVSVALASRPFTGFEDFVRRLVLPAAGLEALPADAPAVPDALADGQGFIDSEDALALYLNARNANDGWLSVSTMPVCFTSRDVFALDLRATVNAPSGVQRATALRQTVELVVPQRELLQLWRRQEDFSEAFRFDREAPGWMSGPNALARFDSGASPPRRVWAHMGTFEGQPYLPGLTPELEREPGAAAPRAEHVFASRDDDGYAQLWPARVAETPLLSGRVVHFDHETRDPEGRYLPDEPLAFATDEDRVAWVDPGVQLLRPLSLSMWVKPRQAANGVLFDVGASDLESDRVSLLFEEGDLVLRVLDGPGDHRETTFVEAGEVRYALAPGDDPGLPLDAWSHVSIDVRGNRPDQMTMLVNGLTHGVRTPGLTTLTAGVSATDPVLRVESTEGFPPRCVLRIGNELIEARVDGANSFRAEHLDAGPEAGFGGRAARVAFQSDDPASGPVLLPPGDHAAGTPVSIYGYSLPLEASGAPGGRADLPDELGPFRVAVLRGVVGAGQTEGEAVQLPGLFLSMFGMEGTGSQVTGLTLASADGLDIPAAQFMDAFDRSGGYAAIMQISPKDNGAGLTTVDQTVLGGVEVIRYSGWSTSSEGTGAVLQVAARGDVVAAELPNYGGSQLPDVGGARAFVTDWNGITSNGVPIQDLPQWRAYVVPLSLPVPGASAVQGFLVPQNGDSEFAQITRVDDAEQTEWVRYDHVDTARGFLVRDDPPALQALYDARGGAVLGQLQDPPGPGGPGGPGGGGGGGGQAAALPPSLLPAAAAPAAPATPAAAPTPRQQLDSPSLWVPNLGWTDDGEESFPISRTFGDALQFRGVLGTRWHRHPRGTPVLPVFGVSSLSPDVGRPGRLDTAFLVGALPDHVGWPVVVHRAHAPSPEIVVQQFDLETSQASSALVPQAGFRQELIRVALQDRVPEPIPGGPVGGTGAAPAAFVDSRGVGRLVAFPSGERPRLAVSTAVGGLFNGGGNVPAAVVDEVVFGNARFAQGTGSPESTAGGQLMLVQAMAAGDDTLVVSPTFVRLPGVLVPRNAPTFLDDYPEDAGLLRVGTEILAYDQRDPGNGTITVAAGGRGLLGTVPTAHAVGEPVTFLEHIAVSALAGDVGPGDARLPLKDTTEFPSAGTVLIGQELIHYTALRESGLWMPARSSEPGAKDGRGQGLFRGRFGTQPAGHAAGEAVILFPFRYWDRWAELADGPELHYLGMSIDQPAAFWRSVFWTAEDASGAARVGVLQRTDPDVPWDADPETTPGLELYWSGTREGAPIPLGVQSDRIEWRVLVQYRPNAFDPLTGLQHGWKETPRLRELGAFYLAPGLTLRSLDR